MMDESQQSWKPGLSRSPTNPFSDEPSESIDFELVGCVAQYRLGFSGSPVPQLLDKWLAIGDVYITQSLKPFRYQYTDVVTTDHEMPQMFETTRRLWSRPGQLVTVAQTEFLVKENRAGDQIDAARSLCESAFGALSAVIDERFMDRRLGEFVSVKTANGVYFVDTTNAMRSFAPGIGGVSLKELTEQAASYANDPVLQSALKFYARGVENRLTEIGYVLYAATADMLAGGRSKLNPSDLKRALDIAGQPDRWNISKLKKITQARGRLIHNGMLPSAEMYELWYDLEEIVRTLLRHKMRVRSDWHDRVPMYEGPALAPPTDLDEEPAPDGATP